MKKIGLLLFIVLLSACGSSTSTKICDGKPQADMTTHIEMQYKDKEVHEVTYENTIKIEDEKTQSEFLKAQGKATKEKLDKIEGITYKYSITKKVFKETTIVDLKNGDLKEFEKAGVVYANGDMKSISLEESITQFESMGLKCK